MGSLKDFSDLRKKQLERVGNATPSVEKMKAIGHRSEEWDSVLFLDPGWTDQSAMAMCTSLYAEKRSSSEELEPCSSLSTPLTYTFMARAHGDTSRTRSRPVQLSQKSWKF